MFRINSFSGYVRLRGPKRICSSLLDPVVTVALRHTTGCSTHNFEDVTRIHHLRV